MAKNQLSFSFSDREESHRSPIKNAGRTDRTCGQEKRLHLRGLQNDLQARKRFSVGIFHLVKLWLSAIFAIVLLEGLLSKTIIHVFWQTRWFSIRGDIGFNLSDTILVALIGATTANVLALFFLVVRYLFPAKPAMSERADLGLPG